MKVTIVGGWSVDSDEQEAWDLRVSDQRTRDTFIDACKLIGKTLAAKGHTLVVGSASDNSADPYVVAGFLSEYKNREVTAPLIHVIQGLDSEGDLYATEREEYQNLFQGIRSHFSGEKPRAAEKILALRDADALIAIGGLEATYVAGIAALVAKRSVVPIASFGGAALQLWHAVHMIGNLEETDDFNRLADEIWKPSLVDSAFRFGGLDRPRVFLGSSSKAKNIAEEICRYVESLGFCVVYWKRDFRPTQIILDELRAASFSCKYAILLLTPDEKIDGESRWVPRDNVLFEVGYFINALGREKTAVIVQKPVNILADYSGHIYFDLPQTGEISAIEIKLQEFLAADIQTANS